MLTINILRPVEIYPEYSAIGQCYDQHIIGYLSSDKVGGDGELQLDTLDIEDWEVLSAGGGSSIRSRKAVLEIERHPVME